MGIENLDTKYPVLQKLFNNKGSNHKPLLDHGNGEINKNLLSKEIHGMIKWIPSYMKEAYLP